MTPTQATTRPSAVPPTVCDFGWWYGSSQEVAELSYTINGVTYPPGATQLAGFTTQTLPSTTVTVISTATFESSGRIMVGALGSGVPQPVVYTGLTSTTFTGCTGGVGTFPLTINSLFYYLTHHFFPIV